MESMQGKHVVITGATAGIGRAAAIDLAGRGAQLTLLCRNLEKGSELAAEITASGGSEPNLVETDMADLGSVRRAASDVLAHNPVIDVLLNNAGVVNTTRRVTTDGFEETLAVNHFAPFLLTGLLLPAIEKAPAGRIVNTASDAHTFVKGMGFDDMQAENGYRTFREYGRSKLANILFTRELASRLADSGITVNSLHPGAVATSLGSQNDGLASKILPPLLKWFFRSPEKGAETSIYLCCSDEVSETTGEYFVDCRVRKAKPWARDDDAARKLWDYTEQALGFRFPA